MEENLTTVADDVTSPQVPADSHDAVSITDSPVSSDPTLPAESEETTDASISEPEGFTVKFNKQLRSLSRDDAIAYAQKGLKYDTVQPLLDTLKYVATAEGKTLPELVEAIREQNEQSTFTRLMDRCGDEDIARELMEVERGRHQAAYNRLLEQEQNEERDTEAAITRRLAEEFEVLQREFPQLNDFAQVPQPIVQESVTQGISLLDAYLRHEHREHAKAEAANASRLAAAEASTGSQASTGESGPSPVIAAMLRGVWGRA